MRSFFSRILWGLLALLLIIGIAPLAAGAAPPIDPATIAVGDSVYFGRYPQTQTTSIAGLTPGEDYVQVGTRYFLIEPIQWLVVENDGQDLLLLSKYSLEYKVWHATPSVQVTWADSDIRAWLNSGFFSQAFTAIEQSMIPTTDVENPETPPFLVGGTTFPGGPNTLDKIFLLSWVEIEDATGSGQLFLNAPARVATVTDYVFYSPLGGYRQEYWWTRSQGRASYSAWTINNVPTGGVFANQLYRYTYSTARPAFELDLETVYFTARDGGGYKPHLKARVTFDPQNGDPTFRRYVVPGDPVTQPAPDPTKAGYVFDGWWTDDDGGTLWDFSTPVTGNMTLYAHWLEIFTVTFDPQNGMSSFEVTVTQGSPVAEPPAPTKAGFAFSGWWTDPLGSTLWDFTNPVEEGFSLYAQWAQLYSVIYQSGTSDTVTNMPADRMLAYLPGDSVVISTSVPKRPGYTFKGWTVAGIDPSAVVGGAFTMPATDVVFTAVWTKDASIPPAGDSAAIGVFAMLLVTGAVSVFGASRRKTR